MHVRKYAAALIGIGVLTSAPTLIGAPASAEDPAVSPLRLAKNAPVAEFEVDRYNMTTWAEIAVTAVAQGEAFELRAKRAPSYSEPIRTEWMRNGGPVTLPTGSMRSFAGLSKFIKVEIRNKAGKIVAGTSGNVCLNSWQSQRTSPDAPFTSPYPKYGCPTGKYTLGSVQGIQEDWGSRLDIPVSKVRLAPGRYSAVAYIPAEWREVFGIAREDATSTFPIVVTRESVDDDYEVPPGVVPHTGDRRAARSAALQPAASEPARASAGAPSETMPDLRSLPAFWIQIDRQNRDYLDFAADVWNAGNGPLVVDGFRRSGEDVMDAYQYFLDADGDQTGYQQVGQMEWDPRTGHTHWHFKDFARYSLLNADKTEVVRSRKEAFCLVNTDAVDYTVPGADWNPDNTDLHSSCGDKSSLSVRETLAAGSGDTYQQSLPGQSFSLKGLPNGTYYIKVEANPERRLVESDSSNNTSLRRIEIGGVPGARTVKAFNVGRII